MDNVKYSGINHPDLFGGESRIMIEATEDEQKVYKVEVNYTRTVYEYGDSEVYVKADSENEAITIAEESVGLDESGWADEIEVRGVEEMWDTQVPDYADILEG